MPTHNHVASTSNTGAHKHGTSWGEGSGSPAYGWYDTTKNHFGMGSDSDYDNMEIATSTDGNHTHTVTVNKTGSSQPHNNLPPYLSVYIFKRTA